MQSLLCRLSTLALVLAFAPTALCQEWTRFRGPNGTGISDCSQIPAKWSEANRLWATKLPAGGHSSPVLWGNRVFLTGAEAGENGRRAVFAIDSKSGDLLWTRWYSAKDHRKHQLNSFASATPTVDSDHVYVSWTTPNAYFVKALTHDGNDVWSRNLGPFVSQHSGGASLVKFENLLIVVNEQDAEGGGKSSWLALDSRTGKTVWHIPRTSDVVIYSTPCERKTEDGAIELVFNSQPHGITGINPRTGKVNWELADLFDKRTVSSPVVAVGELVIGTCGSGGGGNYVVAVRPSSASQSESAELKYKITRQAPYVPTPIALDELLFLWSDGGIVTCVEAETGENVWTKRIGGTYYGSPVCIDRRLFCSDVTGNVVVLAAGREFKELAQNPLDELCHSTPAVANGRLYVRTFGTLHCVGESRSER